MFSRKTFVIIAIILYALFTNANARAQSPGFTVSPVKSFIALHRGQEHRDSFILVNRSAEALPLAATVQLFGVQDELGTIDFRDIQGIASAENPAAWLALAKPFLLLNPGESRTVPYALRIPADAPFGTYAIAVVFQTKLPAPQEQSPTAQLLPAIGSLFFADVVPKTGEVSPEGALRVKDFSIPSGEKVQFRPFGASMIHTLRLNRLSFEFVEKSPLIFNMQLANEGVYATRPSGSVSIEDMFGRMVSAAPLPEGAVLPSATRRYAVSFDTPLRFTSTAGIPDFLRRSFLPGRYTATLTLSSNSPYLASPQPKTLVFWAFPRVFMLSTVPPLTALLYFVVRYRRRIFLALKTFIYG